MLADVVSYLQTAFTARSCPIPIYFGEQYLEDHGGSKVVIVPTSDEYSAPDPSAPSQTTTLLNPRPLLARKSGAVAHIWAYAALPALDADPVPDVVRADYVALDALLNCFLACLVGGVARGVSSIGPGTYVNDKAVHVRRGIVYQQKFTVGVPILDIPFPGGLTYLASEMEAEITVKTSLGEPPTDQTGAQFHVPTPEE